MRALVVVLAIVGSGCAKDPCAGASGVCIAAEVTGNVSGLDQLRIGVDTLAPRTITTPETPSSSFGLPVKVGIVLLAGSSGTVQVTVEGLSNGNSIAFAGPQAVTLPPHGTVSFALVGGVLPDDLAVPAGSDLSTVTNNGMLSITPAMAAFPDTVRGSSSSAIAFMVTNIGGATVASGAPTVGGAQASSFTLASTCNATTMLAAGNSCTINVTFAPKTSSASNATLSISGLNVPLSGTGLPGWTAEASGLSMAITSVWAAAPTTVLAAGNTFVRKSAGDGNWILWNYGITAGYAYALGGSGTSDQHTVAVGGPTHFIWNGTQWSGNNLTGSGVVALNAVTSTSSSDVFVVGQDGSNGALWHYDGTAWTEFSSPLLTDGGLVGLNVTAVSAPAAGFAWAVGAKGTVLTWNSSGSVFTDVSLSISPRPSATTNLFTVWAKSANEVWIGGQSNYVIHVVGNALTTENLHATSGGDVGGIAGRMNGSAVDLWAISGDVNTAFHSTGNNDWTAVTLPTVGNPQSLTVLPDGEVYVGGNSGVIAHYY